MIKFKVHLNTFEVPNQIQINQNIHPNLATFEDDTFQKLALSKNFGTLID